MKTNTISHFLKSIRPEREINYSLDRFKEALKQTGNPEKNLNTFMVAGTNGKGSTAIFLSAGLRGMGYEVATFLSPHLQSITERFVWNGEPAPEAELVPFFEELKPVVDELNLSYFEYLALVFFHWVKAKRADYVVLEVGLGGRLDATNVTFPTATLLTTIGFDHMKILGETLPEILKEKLGVVKPTTFLFTSVTQPELVKQIETFSEEEVVTTTFFDPKKEVGITNLDWSGVKFIWDDEEFSLPVPSKYLAQNAALAMTALATLFPDFEHLLPATIPGRFEIVSTSPRVILSGDHNPQGVDALVDTLQTLGVGPLKIVCGFSPDKPKEDLLAKLRLLTNDITVVGIPQFEPGADPKAEIETILSTMEPNETLLITGSLYLVGEVRNLWRNECHYF